MLFLLSVLRTKPLEYRQTQNLRAQCDPLA